MIDYSFISVNEYMNLKKTTPQEEVLECFIFIHILLYIILISNYLGN